ncbi:MAG: hypothetical protein KAS76_02250, partial [Thermoplasmatales archaeon]|nr:hypothetical protein [Thermoplasmatales archaeon]
LFKKIKIRMTNRRKKQEKIRVRRRDKKSSIRDGGNSEIKQENLVLETNVSRSKLNTNSMILLIKIVYNCK